MAEPSSGLAAYKLAFTVSPIYLTGGIAGTMPGGVIPLMALTQSLDFISLLSPVADLDLDRFFAHYQPMPGSTLLNQQVATYPYANQQTAANALIVEARTLSMVMICPVRGAAGYLRKTATMTMVADTLTQHNSLGGTYTVMTPARIETNMLLTKMECMDGGDTHQPQWRYRLDFYKPLVTMADAISAQNNMMSKMSEGQKVTPVNGEIPQSGPQIAGGSPSSGVGGTVVPSNQPLEAPATGSNFLPPGATT
jgi:hypothetical protein